VRDCTAACVENEALAEGLKPPFGMDSCAAREAGPVRSTRLGSVERRVPPHVQQVSTWDCGLACVRSALATLGLPPMSAAEAMEAFRSRAGEASSVWTIDLLDLLWVLRSALTHVHTEVVIVGARCVRPPVQQHARRAPRLFATRLLCPIIQRRLCPCQGGLAAGAERRKSHGAHIQHFRAGRSSRSRAALAVGGQALATVLRQPWVQLGGHGSKLCRVRRSCVSPPLLAHTARDV
jgi:hypothetical protein